MKHVHAFLVAMVLFPLGPAISAQEDEPKRPLYHQTLRMPLRGDDFRQPVAVVADLNANEVFVCDPLNHRIAIFDHNGLFKFEIRGGVSFRAPIDLAVDPEGYLYVLSTHKGMQSIVRLDFDGKFLEVLELEGMPAGSGGQNLRSLAISNKAKRLYLSDQWRHRLWITDLTGEVIKSIDFEEGLTEDEIEDLRLGEVDVYGDKVLLGMPMEGTIHMYDLDGDFERTVGVKGGNPCQLSMPIAGAIDELGRVIILDQQRASFQVWEPKTNKCLHEYYGFGNQRGAMRSPLDLALDRQGQIFTSQGFEGRVQMYKGGEPAALEDSDEGPSAE